MAVDWIKMRSDLQTHPKVRRIASAVGADKFRAIGGLHAVWSLFDAHSEDGSLRFYTPDDLDSEIGFAGFSRAMESVEWLTVETDRLCLPEFDEHNGQSAKRRGEDQKRKRDSRKSVRTMSDEDGTQSGLDKRREEKKERKLNAREAVESFEVTEDLRRWAAEKVPGVNVDAATDSWRDFLRANGYRTRQGPVLDATGSWRNWMRNEVKFDRGNNGNRNSTAGNGRSSSRGESTPPREAREPIVVTGRTPKL